MDEVKQSLVEHLDEFRKRLIYCLISFGILSAFSWRLTPQVIKYASAPAGNLVFIHPTEAFFTYLKVSLWTGFFFSLPFIIYNIWKFVEVGIVPRERKYLFLFMPASFLLFLAGAGFGFFFAIPLAVKFLIGFGAGFSTPMLSIGEYVSFVSWLLLAFGASFELPLVILFLVKLKIVNAAMLKSYRKHAILLIFIAAAVLTPTPDAITQLLLAGPLILLYEAGVLLSKFS